MAVNAVIGALRVVLGMDTAAFDEGASDAQKQVAKFGKNLQKWGVSLSTYLSAPLAAAGAGLVAAVTGIAANVSELQKSAQVANAGFEEFQRMALAARTVGIEQDKLADILKDVNDRVGDFVQTGGGPMADFFEKIAPKVGVTAEAFRNLSGPQALQLYYDSLKKAGANQQDMTFYMEAMASDLTALLPLLENGGEKMRELGAAGPIIREDQAAGLKAYNDAMRGLGDAIQGVAVALATSGVIDFATMLATTLAEWINVLGQTNPELLKWGTIIGGLAAVIGPAVGALGIMVSAVAAIGLPVAAAIAGVTALAVAVVAFWPEIKAAGAVVAEFVSGAWARFVAAWDGMVDKIDRVSTSIKQFSRDISVWFSELPAKMLEIGGQIIDGLWNGIKARWENVKGQISAIGTGIATSVKDALGIHSPSRVMHEVGVNTMQGLSDGMAAMQGAVGSVASATAGQIKDAFEGLETVGSSLGEGMESAFEGIGSSLTGVIKGTKDWRDVAIDALGNIAQQILSTSSLGGGIGGSLLKGIFGGLIGFAHGGSIMPGGSGGIDSQMVAFRKSPSEQVDIYDPSKQRSAATSGVQGVRVYVDQDGNWQAAVERISDARARVVTQAGLSEYDRTLPGRVGEITERYG